MASLVLRERKVRSQLKELRKLLIRGKSALEKSKKDLTGGDKGGEIYKFRDREIAG